MKVVVSHPATLPAAVARLSEGWRWIYGDGDAAVYTDVHAFLWPIGERLLSPAEFQSAVVDVRGRFISWVDRNLAGASAERFIAAPLDKNPFTSRLFLHVSCVYVLSQAVRGAGRDILVVTDSPGFARTVEKLSARAGAECEWIASLRSRTTRVGRELAAVARFSRDACQLLIRMLLARLILGAAYRRKCAGVNVLIESYVHDGDVRADGSFSERYFPGLVAWYRSQGFSVGVYPVFYRTPLRHFPSLYRAIKRGSLPILPFELFATVLDLSTAFAWSCRAMADTTPVAAFDGEDVSGLVGEGRLTCALDAFVCLVLLSVPKRMVAAGIEPHFVIDWFENQRIDKATYAGFRRASVRCAVFGVRQYLLYPNWLSMFTTTQEVDAGVAPSETWVCGPAQAKLAATYDTRTTCTVVPALRYAHLHHQRVSTPSGRDRGVLVLLTHSIDESVSILSCVMDGSVPLTPERDEITIKLHPDLPAETVRRLCAARWPHASVTWASGKLHELLDSKRVVVTGGTSAAVEAISYGIPVVMVGQAANVDINPLETVDGRMWQIVYDADELRTALRRWSPHPMNRLDRAALGARIRNENFEPATDASMNAFLPFSCATASDGPRQLASRRSE